MSYFVTQVNGKIRPDLVSKPILEARRNTELIPLNSSFNELTSKGGTGVQQLENDGSKSI